MQYLKKKFLYFKKLFKLILRPISHSIPGGGIRWKMPEIILISRGQIRVGPWAFITIPDLGRLLSNPWYTE
jgi:hypothetical protein